MDKIDKKYLEALTDLRQLIIDHPDTKIKSFLRHRGVTTAMYETMIDSKIIKIIDLGHNWIGGKPTGRMVTFLRNTNSAIRKGNINHLEVPKWTERGEERILESYIKIGPRKFKIHHIYG